MGKVKKKRRWLFYGLIFIILILGIFFIGLQMKLKDLSREVSAIDVNDIDLSLIEDGSYEGEYYHNEMVGAKVMVQIQDHRMVSIEFLDHKYGRGQKAEGIVDSVIDKQSLRVDAIAGATSSSTIIRKAIENALTN